MSRTGPRITSDIPLETMDLREIVYRDDPRARPHSTHATPTSSRASSTCRIAEATSKPADEKEDSSIPGTLRLSLKRGVDVKTDLSKNKLGRRKERSSRTSGRESERVEMPPPPLPDRPVKSDGDERGHSPTPMGKNTALMEGPPEPTISKGGKDANAEVIVISNDNDTDDDREALEELEEDNQELEYDTWDEESQGSVESLRSLGLDKKSARKLVPGRPKLKKGKGTTRGRGRPPTSGDFICRAATAKAAAAAETELEEAQLIREVTNKLSSAVTLYRADGSLVNVPLRGMGATIEEAADAVIMVSKASKRLKGTMVSRLKTAVALIRNGVEELQRRLGAVESVTAERGAVAATDAAMHQWAVAAEAEVYNLMRELERKRGLRQAMEERLLRSPSPAQQLGEVNVAMRDVGDGRRSPAPLPQRLTRAKTKAMAKEKRGEGGRGEPEQRAPTPPPPPSQAEWPAVGGEDAPITIGMLPAITVSIIGDLTKFLGSRIGLPTPPDPKRAAVARTVRGSGGDSLTVLSAKTQARAREPPKTRRRKERRKREARRPRDPQESWAAIM